MGVYRKPQSPFWYAAWMAPVLDESTGRMRRRPDGAPIAHQVHRSTKEKLKSKAQAKLRRWEGEAQRILALSEDEELDRVRAKEARAEHEDRKRKETARLAVTLKDLRDLWLKHAAPKKSLRDDTDRFETMLEVLGADVVVADLRTADVHDLRDELLKRRSKRGKPYSKATVNRFLALLRSALRAAEDHGYEHSNPMRGVKLLREDNKRDRICSREEYEELIAAATPKLRLAIVLAYQTGMRRGDIAALTWDAIDLKERIIRVRSQDEKTGEGRTIPITEEVVEELFKIKPKQGPLFPYTPRKDGSPYDAGASFGSEFSDLTRELGIPDLHFHDFRHTASTNLRRAGADLFTLAALTGHKDLATLRRYQTITQDDLRAAVERSAKAQKRKAK
jgi:integrase